MAAALPGLHVMGGNQCCSLLKLVLWPSSHHDQHSITPPPPPPPPCSPAKRQVSGTYPEPGSPHLQPHSNCASSA